MQTELYTAFSESVIKGALASGEKSDFTSPFKILNYLRKLIDHPCMVLNDGQPQSNKIRAALKESGTKLTDLSLSGKFLALRELLYDCGIGVVDDEEGGGKKSGMINGFYLKIRYFVFLSDGSVPTAAVSQHRALVFCQWRATVDLLVDYLNRGAMGDVTYLRLDGTTPVNQRQVVVDRFNADPSIDLLLLTTHVCHHFL